MKNTTSSGTSEEIYADYGLEYLMDKLPRSIEVTDSHGIIQPTPKKMNAYLRIGKCTDNEKVWFIYYESAFTKWHFYTGKLIDIVTKIIAEVEGKE